MMTRRNQERRRKNPRRRLFTERLEDRRLLAAYDFVPSDSIGVQREEIDGITVLTVAPDTKINISAQVTSADDPLFAFGMDFNGTDSSVVLDNFQSQLDPNIFTGSDTDLNLDLDRVLLVSFSINAAVSVPPVLTLGTFDVTAPSATGDYKVTVDPFQSPQSSTGVLVIGKGGLAFEPLTDFGDLIIRVADTPPLPTVSISTSNQTVDEDAGNITLTATLSAVSDTDVSIPFAVSGTAAIGGDFTITPSPITIAAGATSGNLSVAIIDDAEVELAETVVLELGTPTGADLGSQSSNTITIVDDDEAIPTDNARVFSPPLVEGPLVVPGDGFSSTVIFGAVFDTTLSVGHVASVAVNGVPNVGLFDENLNPIAVDSQGVLTARLQAGSLYALMFNRDVDRRIFRIGSSAGFGALVQTVRTNIIQRTDVNGNGETTSLDALMVINQLGRQGGASGEAVGSTGRFYDVNADGRISALDALQVINRLQLVRPSAASGELITDRIDESDVLTEVTDSLISTIRIKDAEGEKAAAFDPVRSNIAGGHTIAVAFRTEKVDQVMAEWDQPLRLLNQKGVPFGSDVVWVD
ncbi:extracellular nuclease [Rhodopirellula maiorica SM1]|uniref:Extracellular nuclease n=1 Tax=Rhodopirellula maiorica SM1 TaxID=1265738 RepID=M5RI02_9BACT|nr:dockerin type I domain-containing protein [Rhodopirellula maiorica]EMI18920.1 extracellular nuclease [Rhodopirellula maiorica SM1]